MGQSCVYGFAFVESFVEKRRRFNALDVVEFAQPLSFLIVAASNHDNPVKQLLIERARTSKKVAVVSADDDGFDLEPPFFFRWTEFMVLLMIHVSSLLALWPDSVLGALKIFQSRLDGSPCTRWRIGAATDSTT